MEASGKDPNKRLKAAVTAVALIALLVRTVFPNLKLDAVALGLLVLAVLPWLSPLIKSAELPGGFKIEFQDVKEAAERVATSEPEALAAAPSSEPTFLAIADQDPNLALVGLRIEIEKRLRTLADRAQIPRNKSLSVITRELQERGMLHAEAAGGLRDLVALGNQAAHGVAVASDVAYSAVEYGPRVLQVLDAKLIQLGGPP